MNKKTRKLFTWCLVVCMVVVQMLFSNVAFAATDSYKGNSRFDTALTIVDKGWTTKSDVAVIARGDVDGSDLADALAAAPLAYANGKAPVFITEKDKLTDGIMTKLTALEVKKVYIVGGTGAVSQAVEDTLVAKFGAANVIRVKGGTRVETSLEVAKLVKATPTEVVLVNGYASADALSAAPVAAAKGMPILFTADKNTLSDAVKAYIGTAKVYVVGGTGVISDAVLNAVNGKRVAGLDRFATNAAVLAEFAPDCTTTYLAKGADANAIDALAGAPLAALTNSPIVFVDDNNTVDAAKAFLSKNLKMNSKIIGLGGPVTSAVLATVDGLRPADLNVDSVSAITAKLNNPINDTYKDVVFQGSLAQILVKAVDKSGNPVANVPVVFYVTDETNFPGAEFADSVAYTGSDGVAIGFLGSAQEITAAAVTATYKAEVVGKTVAPVEGKVRFAELNVGTVTVTGPLDSDDNLELTHRNLASDVYDNHMITQNMNENDTEYVASQQVSPAGADDHAVSFEVTPQMTYIADDQVKQVDTYSKTVGWSSGAYHPYDELTSDNIEIPAGLKYATIYLKNLQLDENARLTVAFYDSDDNELDDVTVEGPIDDTNRAVQIPQNVLEDISYFTVTVETNGQVNTTLNGGVTVDKVEGVFETDGTTTDTDITIPGVKINWTLADTVYSETKAISAADVWDDYGIDVDNAAKYDYKVPVFPMTGDAVLTAYDSNNKVLKYYLIPTENNGENVNVLKDDPSILASKNEVSDKVGTITTNADGTEVTVNSEKVGVSLLKGVIEIPGMSKDVLNATNATVYTSVNWAPLPKADDTTANSKLFALQGQKITVVAQLVDENGNPATEEDETVTLLGDFPATVGVSPNTKVAGEFAGQTDSNGQVKWTLSSSALNMVADLEADNDNYDVVLKIGDASVSTADLYWVGAQLTHKPDFDTAEMTGPEAAAAKYQAEYNVGDPVEFGFEANGIVKTHLDAGVVDYDWDLTNVKLANVPVNFTKVSGTVGTAEKITDKPYAFLAKSDRAGVESVNAKIGTMTNAAVTVQFSDDEGDSYTDGTFVGTGTSSISDTFKMNIAWQSEGQQFGFVVPSGEVAATGTDVTVYVKLTDSLGNPLKGEALTAVTIDNEDVVGLPTSDANGVIAITVDHSDDADTQTTVKAEYNGEVQYFSINWVEAKQFGIVSAGVNTSGANDVVTVTFNNDINPNSVTAKQFTITDGATVYGVKSFEVDGNQVKLTLADSSAHLFDDGVATEFTVTYAPYAAFTGENAGIEFNMVDVDGNPVDLDTITFMTRTNATVRTIDYDGAGTLAVTYDNADNLPVYVVDANGVITTVEPGHALDGTGHGHILVDDDASSCTVYVNGEGTVYNW